MKKKVGILWMVALLLIAFGAGAEDIKGDGLLWPTDGNKEPIDAQEKAIYYGGFVSPTTTTQQTGMRVSRVSSSGVDGFFILFDADGVSQYVFKTCGLNGVPTALYLEENLFRRFAAWSGWDAGCGGSGVGAKLSLVPPAGRYKVTVYASIPWGSPSLPISVKYKIK